MSGSYQIGSYQIGRHSSDLNTAHVEFVLDGNTEELFDVDFHFINGDDPEDGAYIESLQALELLIARANHGLEVYAHEIDSRGATAWDILNPDGSAEWSGKAKDEIEALDLWVAETQPDMADYSSTIRQQILDGGFDSLPVYRYGGIIRAVVSNYEVQVVPQGTGTQVRSTAARVEEAKIVLFVLRELRFTLLSVRGYIRRVSSERNDGGGQLLEQLEDRIGEISALRERFQAVIDQ